MKRFFFIEVSSLKAIFIENVANSLVLIVTARSLLAYFLCSQTYFVGGVAPFIQTVGSL
jgi:hypothetical protein